MDENYDTENPLEAISVDGEDEDNIINMLIEFENNLELPVNFSERKVLEKMAK